jgi:hypothetical protein
MKYYLDCEFLEGKQKESFPVSLFRKETPNTIDLISIGIVSSDSREYYAISKDFNLKEAWNRYDLVRDGFRDFGMSPNYKKVYWIRENVLKPLFKDLWYEKCHLQNLHHCSNNFTYGNLKTLISLYGKTNKQIAGEVEEFCSNNIEVVHEEFREDELNKRVGFGSTPIEFHAYYADYDWVAFCWLFGKMIDLPLGFPMYCFDLKQEMDRVQQVWVNKSEAERVIICKRLKLFAVEVDVKNLSNYPKQTNEHNALSDARWNKELHEFLNKL